MAESVELFCSFHKLSSFGAKYSRRTTPKPTASVLHASDSSSRRNYGLCCRALDAKSVDGGEMFSVTSSSKSDVDYLGESTKGDLNVKKEHLDAFGLDGQFTLDGPIEEIARVEAREAEMLLGELGIVDLFSSRHSPRGIFCSRTLNLRSISAIGYDMDYTLIHYNVMAWEGRAYDYGMANLKSMGFPVDGLEFDPNLVIRGLIMDKERGNLVKADRFGYVKRAMHGTRMLSTKAVSEIYGRELVDLRKESRWEFLNTLFTVSEAVMYMQVIVSARKPEFFQMSHPMYEIVTSDGLMCPCFKATTGGLYSGGSAQMVEKSLGIHGDEILYVGDHIYTDVSQSKVHLRWRTALICRELEDEFNALIHSRSHRSGLVKLLHQKEIVGDLFNQLHLALQRRLNGHPAQTRAATNMDDQELTESMQKLLIVMQRLDDKIAPKLEADGEHFNKRYADIYTSRVSNFLHYTPFMYFCAQEQTLAHDSCSYTPSDINGCGVDDLNRS